MSTFDLGSAGTTAINTILAEEANRINQDVYTRTVHTSAWMDLMKQTAFPDGMGYQLSTLVYDRAIPTTDSAGDTAGVNWSALGTLNASANSFDTSDLGQPLKDAADDVQGGRGTGGPSSPSDNRSYVQFSKQLKKYNIDRAVIESPRISLEDLRFAAHRQEQLRAIMDNMAESTRYTWENRYRDEFSKVADSYVGAVASGTAIESGFEGTELAGTVDLSAVGSGVTTPTSNISNALLDKAYFNLVRKGAGNEAYGRENGRPVFGLVLSSEASYQLQTEAGFRDDVRYNNSKVSDLIAPLGVEKSFRGFYHLVDDLSPRFTLSGDSVTRVLPYTVSSGVTTPNSAYESAEYEAAFVIHPHVCESQIPNPFSGAQGISFDPVSYRGDFKWTNIPNEVTNPDGTIGFFRGVLASATKPIKTDFGFVILFKRTSTTPAA